jgi:hypothetical protein
MRLRTIVVVNLVLGVLACLSHVPVLIANYLGVAGFEEAPVTWLRPVVILDVVFVAACVVALLRPSAMMRVLMLQCVVLGIGALAVFLLAARIAVLGTPNEGNYSFGVGLTTALCAYAVYVGRRIANERVGVPIGRYHWYVAGVVGVVELGMLARFAQRFVA